MRIEKATFSKTIRRDATNAHAIRLMMAYKENVSYQSNAGSKVEQDTTHTHVR
jgi:hypothetical protein